MRDFAVGALELFEEVESHARRGEVAVGVEGERSPHGVATEEPGEAGPLALARRAEARDQARAEQRVFDQALVNADLRPRERLVDAVVRRHDGRRLFGEPPVVLDVLLVKLARGVEDSPVRSLRVATPFDAPGDDDGDEVRLQLAGRHVDEELCGHVARLLLVWHDRHVARGGAADDAREAARLFGDEIGALTLVPRKASGHQASGPHQFQAGAEADGHGEREHAVNVEQHEDARLVQGREDRLSDGEGRVSVGNGGRLGADVDRGRRVGGAQFERVAFEAERQLEPFEDFERIDPRF